MEEVKEEIVPPPPEEEKVPEPEREEDDREGDRERDREREGGDEERPRRDDEEQDENITGKKRERTPETFKLVIRNLPFESKEEDVRDMFESCGQIDDIYFPKFPDSGRAKGYAFITYRSKESFERALEYDGKYYDGRPLIVEQARSKGGRDSSGFSGRTRQVFVGRLNEDISEKDLEDLFANCGRIIDVRMPRYYDSGRPKGFAFVEFDSVDDVREALRMDGTAFKGCTLRVNEEIRRRRRGGFGGRGGGGFGGGGGGGGGRGYGRPRYDRYDDRPRHRERRRYSPPPRRERDRSPYYNKRSPSPIRERERVRNYSPDYRRDRSPRSPTRRM